MLIGHATLPLIIYGIFPRINLIALLWGAGISNFDIIPTIFREEEPEEEFDEIHGATVLHTPFFFVVTLLPLIYIFGYIPAISFFIGGMTHMFLDSLDRRGRRLFYPFSDKFYGIDAFPYDFWTYMTSKKMLAMEGTLFLISCFLLLR